MVKLTVCLSCTDWLTEVFWRSVRLSARSTDKQTVLLRYAVNWLVKWQKHFKTNWLTDWLAHCVTGLLTDLMTDWLTDWSVVSVAGRSDHGSTNIPARWRKEVLGRCHALKLWTLSVNWNKLGAVVWESVPLFHFDFQVQWIWALRLTILPRPAIV